MKYRFLALVIGSGLMLPGYAQQTTDFKDVSVADVSLPPSQSLPEKLTYSECVERAIASNPDIRQTILSILQADEDIAVAKDAWLPSVNFSTSHNYANYPVASPGRDGNSYNSSYGIGASWTVWEGNARKYRLESSRLLRRQQELSGENLEKEIRLSILQAYLNILYAREAIDIASKTLEVSSYQAERAKKLMQAGRSSQVDVAQIESQRAQDEYNLVQAQSSLASYKMTLKKLLALRLDADTDIADTKFPDSEVTTVLPPADATYAAAISWLPELQSNELSREVYANDVKIARAGRLPDISMQAGVGTGYNSGGRSWGWQMGHGVNEYVGLTLSVPIFDANKTKRAVAKANLSAMEADVNRDRLLDDLSQTIEDLYIQARNSTAKFTSGKSRLEAAELTSTLVDRQFELGLVNPLELLNAHNDLLSARLEQLQNKYMAILANKTIEYYNTREINIP